MPAATQWEIVEEAAELIKPARDELIRQAAQGEVLHNDDTSMRVLQAGARAVGDERTGVFTSGIVSTGEGRKIALFFTGRQHAGENIARRAEAARRGTARADPDVRCAVAECAEAARAEWRFCWPTVWRTDDGSLWKWPRTFPNECRYVLEMLGEVYGYDAEARERALTPEERLQFHQQHSGPVMEQLHGWLEAQFAERKTEPNSGLGKAITYLLRHWKALTLFLREAGAPAGQQHRRKSPEAGGPAPQECAVLPDAERGAGGRPVHEPDPHLPVVRRQLVRLPDRAAAARPGTGGQPGGVDAVELPRDAGAGWSMMNLCLAEKDRLRPWSDEHSEMAAKRASAKAKSEQRFWPGTETGENVPRRPVRPRFHAMISRRFRCRPRHAGVCRHGAAGRSLLQVREVGSGAAEATKLREKLLEAARRREIDVVLVWRLDRWGRSVTDLLATLQELEHLGVGFVSLTEALDLTTPAGRAMAGLLAYSPSSNERFCGNESRWPGPRPAERQAAGPAGHRGRHTAEIRKLHRAGVSKSEIARRLQIGRTSVRRILATTR